MSIINKMDDRLANMIAAGEVVDRPASVIKELVENAIDAKATEVTITVTDNGMTLIKVSDNGIGMNEEDAKKAFLRHATSKIDNEFDLERINTLGFRGEALAAILSVSRVELKTREKDNDGIKLVYEDSKLIEEAKASLNIGTEISVKDLFYNTPARFKYVKSEFTERMHIIDTFDRLSLANPQIRFTLIMDDNIVKQTFGNNDYYGLIEQIYGSDITDGLKVLEEEFQKIKIKALLINPKINRSRKKDITFFINGRYIKNYGLTQALIDGYHTHLMTNRYPIAVVYLEMDPILLDVNVHPQKLEVKFVNEAILKYHIELFVKEALDDFPRRRQPSNNLPDMNPKYNMDSLNLSYQGEDDLEVNLFEKDRKYNIVEEEIYEAKIPFFTYVGVVAGTYLIFQNEDGMYLIDQHAAEERIRYEYYYNIEPDIIKMDLLIPRPLELSTVEKETLMHHRKAFNNLGIELNEKSEITSHPTFIKEKHLDLVIDIMLTMLAEKSTISLKDLRDDLAKDKSCKASVKANDVLSRNEVDELIINLRKTKNPFNCPHGRPTMVKLTHYEIERMFKRIV